MIGVPVEQRLSEAQYAELVARVQSAMATSLPPGAGALVISRGDAALVEVPGVSAAHFPQGQDGGWAGHHPADSFDATAQLQRLQCRGAEYLVIPATARWWLKFYAGFAEHLASHCELLADVPDACLIYRLGRREAPAALGDAAPQPPRASIEQMRDYLENLIPPGERIAVLEAGERIVEPLAPMRAEALAGERLEHERPQREHTQDELERASEEAPHALARLARDGVDYLVVPRSADQWLHDRPRLAASIEARCRKIADQRHLCRVFELKRLRTA